MPAIPLRQRRSVPRCVAPALMAMSLLVAAACHDGDGSAGERPSYLAGSIHLGGDRAVALAGNPVRAVDADGVVVATSSVVGCGNFALTAPSWAGFTGRIEVDAQVRVDAGGGLEVVRLAREVRIGAAEHQPGHYWVSVPSTVVSRYVQRHASTGLPSAVAAVESHLGIPAGVAGDTAFGETHRSPASWRTLRAAAVAESLSVDAFLDRLAEEVGTAPRRSLRPAPRYPHLAAAGLGASSTSGQREWGRTVTDTRVMVDGIWMGFALKLAVNAINGPPQPDPVLEAIGEVANDLAQLATTLSANDVSVAWGYTAALAEQAVETIRAAQEQLAQYTQGAGRDPWLAATLLDNRSQELLGAVQMLQQLLAGGPMAPFGPLPSIYARGQSLSRFGPNPYPAEDAAWLSMQLRDNELLEAVRDMVDYYVGWGEIGCQLLANWANTDPATFPTTSIGNFNNQVSRSLYVQQATLGAWQGQTGWRQAVKTAYQLAPPPAIASDDVLVDCGRWVSGGTIGGMYVKMTSNKNGLEFYNDGPSASFNVSTLSLGPWSGAFIYCDLDRYKRLRELALAANPNDVNAGLIQLGFLGLYVDSNGHIMFGYTDISTTYGRKYNFTTDQIGGQLGYSEVANFIYQRGAADDDGTVFATSKPCDVDATANGMAIRYESTAGPSHPVDLVTIQPYGQDASSAFTAYDVLAWTIPGASQVVPSNQPVPDPTAIHAYEPWIWFQPVVPTGQVDAVGRMVTHLSSSGASLGCMPVGISGSQPIPWVYSIVESIQVTPYEQYLSSPWPQSTVNCFATGYVVSTFGRPIRLIDCTQPNPQDPMGPTSVVWSVTSPSGLASFLPGTNVLRLDRLQGYEAMQITATVTLPDPLVPTSSRVLSDTQTCYTQFK